ncbi:MAG: HAD-IA family hydrolase [Bacteroidetes bacterium]|nr:HAD-IA family hydrolase [Bacteroidota bacterium]MCB0846287.1 HAD-IA family hydrolase [Bacteroidota bacterium]
MINIPSHIRGLIFDLDGTLADTMPIHVQAWAEAGKLYGLTITGDMILPMAGMPTVAVVPELNKTFDWNLDPVEFRHHKNEAYYRIKADLGKVRPISHIVKIAESYKDNLPMAVGTGSSHENAIVSLNDLGITHWFKGVVGADDIQNPKPAPDTFLKCADMIKVHPRNCLVFEDGPMGIEAAKAAGMQVIDIRVM